MEKLQLQFVPKQIYHGPSYNLLHFITLLMLLNLYFKILYFREFYQDKGQSPHKASGNGGLSVKFVCQESLK